MNDKWIWICRWETFQHYKPTPGQVPAWTKMYTQLINDEAYLELSSHRRGVLHGLWLAFTSSRCRLGADTRSLSSRLRLRVTSADIDSLNHAGFIQICSRATLDSLYRSSIATLESRAPARSQEKEEEAETPSTLRKVSASSDRSEETGVAAPATPNGAGPLIDRMRTLVHRDWDSYPDPGVLRDELTDRGLPIETAAELVEAERAARSEPAT